MPRRRSWLKPRYLPPLLAACVLSWGVWMLWPGRVEPVQARVELRSNRAEPPRRAMLPVRTTASLSGRVLDASGAAAHAHVRVLREGATEPRIVHTREAGRFQLDGLTPGTYEVWAVSEDGASARERAELPARPDALVLRLGEAKALARGTVRDLSGGVVAGAEVRVANENAGLDRTVALGVSDDRGRYKVRLPPGSYLATVRATGYGRARAVLQVGEDGSERDFDLRPAASLSGKLSRSDNGSVEDAVLTLRPARFGGLEPQWPTTVNVAPHGGFSTAEISPGDYLLFASQGDASASYGPFRLAPGEEKRAIELVLDEAQPLRGTVVSEGGAPIAGAFVTVQQNAAGVTSRELRVETDGTGAFSARGLFAAQATTLIVEHPEYGERVESIGTLPLGQNSGVRVVLQAAVRLRGTVVGSNEQLVPGARVWAEPASGRMRVFGPVMSNEAGEFEIRLPANTDLDAGLVVRARHSSMGLGDVATREASRSLRLQLDPGIYVTGRVRGGDARPTAFARLTGNQAVPSRQGSQVMAVADGQGNFRIGPFEPGVVLVQLGGPLQGIEDGQRAQVTLTAGQDPPSVELRAPDRSARVEGRVLDEHGQPVPDALVVVAPEHFGFAAPNNGAPALTDTTGRFVREGLAPGPHQVFVEVSGYRPLSRALTLPGTIELRLEADAASSEGANEAQKDDSEGL